MPGREEKEAFLISAALERQRLGLTKSEYDALTPFEISCELKALEIINAENRARFEIFDDHMARIALMLNGYAFPELKTVQDFRMVLRKKEKPEGKKRDPKRDLLFSIKWEREKKEFLKRRAELRAAKAGKTDNGKDD